MTRRLLVALVLVSVVAVAGAGAAQAEGERPLPWEGGATVETEAERLFGQAASEIAGRPVQVRCNGETDWAQLVDALRLDPNWWGYVSWNTDFAELAPSACWFLDRYAYTSPKPAYWCTSSTTVTELVAKQKRVRLRTPLLKNGKPVLRKGKRVYVWKTRIVTTTVPQQRERTETVRCEGADEWWKHVSALSILAHESYHLRGIRNEAETECYGLQAVARTAALLGATEAEAKAASDYAWALYPLREKQSPAYWSAECRSDGPLDLSPGDGRWP